MSGSPASNGIAIVGAGIAGLSAARALTDAGRDVVVFDKARGPGGRTARRRQDGLEFDHGAQYFTARDPGFRRHVESWRRDGVVQPWTGRVVTLDSDAPRRDDHDPPERYVAVPGMNGLARHLVRGIDIRCQQRLDSVERRDGAWHLLCEGGATAGPFAHLLLTMPGPQTAACLASACPDLARRCGEARLAPCWALMLAFDRRLETPFDAAFVGRGPIRWTARNASKPGRPPTETWVVHAAPDWSLEHLEQSPEWVTARLTEAFRAVIDDAAPAFAAAHRWRYALVDEPLGEPCLYDASRRVGVAGDWCLGPRIECAFLSGAAVAARV